ncbi:hypothetical protein A3B51_00280 [Candidatus Curtissbacteria bacterium RIFCSPLOWO2_01_FULL_41_18]|uniref:Prepilin-type N-terminal cleavage/methylation domain-containing protein n=2 Tax=Candidatus Curtissiibacteriota TaxID=1752717 RepID=A0A1F5FZJ7_9BACT|nr:MAG: hypothetical protein A2696_02870 [Candidatus Curtissbacteria bacterium RIFCSPHIGHO2_01_FULL_41_13]OGE04618.1 MAG: hypothetical protein A3B51_00280 [Candidatus Curtissbacteria bacterium RIFCSPLOWO2_01_FULL_41_18]
MPNSAYSLQLTAGRTEKAVCSLPFAVYKAGFTLIEFLVVLGILAVTVSSTVLFLNSVLKGSNQSTITAEVKQNGQVVLDSVERQIRGAKDATTCFSAPCPPPPYNHIKLVRVDPDAPLHIKCFSPTSSKNGRIATATGDSPPDSQYVDLTNTDKINGANITNCDFRAFPAGFSAEGQAMPAVVSIKFIVSQGLEAPSRQDYVASVSLQTTISLRRY